MIVRLPKHSRVATNSRLFRYSISIFDLRYDAKNVTEISEKQRLNDIFGSGARVNIQKIKQEKMGFDLNKAVNKNTNKTPFDF